MMVKLFILLTVVVISSFSAIDLMAAEDPTLAAIQDHLWVNGLVEEELPMAESLDYFPPELAVALEREAKI